MAAELPAKPAGVALDLVEMNIDGQPAKMADYPPPYSDFAAHVNLASIPTNAQTADITFAVQKTRTVEFLVKPPKDEKAF